MRKNFNEGFSDIAIKFAKPIVNYLLKKEIKVVISGDKVKKTREPFIMVSNHFNTWDSFIVMQNIKVNIRFVATEIAFLDRGKKFGMGILARAIPKRVGKTDVVATRRILDYLNTGYSIGLFPEGDNTFYGETLPIYATTGKLLKKANVDVVLVKQQGGYISQPRWADNFAKNGIVYTETRTLIKQEELTKLTTLQINDIVEKAIYNNDYDFQREKMIKFNRKNRAEGIERLVYFCSNCGSVMTVFGIGDDIHCSKCGVIGHINEYEFIEGNQFDNLVDYNKMQYGHIKEVINSEFVFFVTLNVVNMDLLKNKKIGEFKLRYKNKQLYLRNKNLEYTFDLDKMLYPVNTMRSSFSFDYQGETYNFTNIRNQFVLYEMCRFLNGSYKV